MQFTHTNRFHAFILVAAFAAFNVAASASDAQPPENKTSLLKPQLMKTDINDATSLQPIALIPLLTTLSTATNGAASANGNQTQPSSGSAAQSTDKVQFDADKKTWLRKYGVAITAGFGYIPDEKELMPSLQARYNFLQSSLNDVYKQDKATREKVIDDDPHLSGYGIYDKGRTPIGDHFNDPDLLTSFSIWGGYGLEKMTITSGDQERPILLGLGIGLGRGPENSSLVNIDAGYTIFDGGSLNDDGHFYVGVGMDGVLLKAILLELGKLAGNFGPGN